MVIALLWIVLGNYIFQKSVRRHFSMTHCHMLFQVIYPDRFFAYDAGMTLFDIIFYPVSYTHLTLPTILLV